MISTENPFELIGKGRYHSCILTTFSFDFNYFNTFIINKLKSRGIQNIIVLVDKGKLDEAIGHYNEKETPGELGYLIEAVESNRIFHPKMMLFAGNNEAALSLGSGNLTMGSFTNSMEAWSSISFNKKKEGYEENKNVICFALNFLNKLSDGQSKFLKTRLDSIRNYCEWVDLKNISDSFKVENGNGKFVTSEKSIFELISSHIDLNQIKNVIIQSPFFDKKGETLKKLGELTPNATHFALLDPDYLDDDGLSNLNNWELFDIRNNKASEQFKDYKFFHSKILYMSSIEKELFLVGSSNLSRNGYGLSANPNIEANFLFSFENTEKKWAVKIGVDKLNHRIDVASVGKRVIHSEDSQDEYKFDKRISSAHLSGKKICLALPEQQNLKCILIVLDNINIKSKESVLIIGNEICCDWEKESKPLMLWLEGPSGNRISNKIFLTSLIAEEKAIPDPEIRKIQMVLMKIEEGGSFFLDSLTDIISTPDLKKVKFYASSSSITKDDDKNEELNLAEMRGGVAPKYITDQDRGQDIISKINSTTISFLISQMKNYLKNIIVFEDTEINDTTESEIQKSSIFLRVKETDYEKLKSIRYSILRFTEKDIRKTYFSRFKDKESSREATFQDVAFFTLVTSILISAINSKAIIDDKTNYFLSAHSPEEKKTTCDAILNVLGIMAWMNVDNLNSDNEYYNQKKSDYLTYINTNVISLFGIILELSKGNLYGNDTINSLKALFKNITTKGWMNINGKVDNELLAMPLEQFNKDLGDFHKIAIDNFPQEMKRFSEPIKKYDEVFIGDIVYHENYGYNVLVSLTKDSSGVICNLCSFSGEFGEETPIPLILKRGMLVEGFLFRVKVE